MTRPIEIPEWATNDEYTSGPDINGPTKLEPTAGEKADGHHGGSAPAAQKENWLKYYLSKWVSHLADIAVSNWHQYVGTEADGTTALSFTEFRDDGTCEVLWIPYLYTWIALGHNVAGHFYIGSERSFFDTNTSAAAPPKLSFGIYHPASTRTLLFNADSYSSLAPDYLRSDAGSVADGDWTTLTFPGTISTTSRVSDAVVTASDRIIVVGRANANQYCWYSDNSGQDWTEVVVAAAGGSDPLNRVVAGDGLLVTFVKGAGPSGVGDKLYTSDDDGATWTLRSAIGFNQITDAVYLPGTGVYLFSTGDSVWFTTDPAEGSFTEVEVATGCTVRALCAVDGAVFAAVTEAGGMQALYFSRDSGVTWRAVHARAAGDGQVRALARSEEWGHFLMMNGSASLQESFRLQSP